MRSRTSSPSAAAAKAAPALAVLLLLAAGLAAAQPVAELPWTTRLVIDSALAHPAKAFEAFDTASLSLYDFNRDGQLEIVSLNDNNHAYVLDSRTGATLAEFVTPHPGGDAWPVRDVNPVSVGDLYGDGVPCLVIPTDDASMSAWCFDAAASKASSFRFVQRWAVKADASVHESDFRAKHPWLYDSSGRLKSTFSIGLDGHAYLADTDGDGRREVFVQSDGYPGQFAFNADGTYRWSRSWYDGNAGPVVLDIDADGRKDACFAGDAGIVTCYEASSGAVKWTFASREHGAFPGSIPVAPLYADLDSDGRSEVFFAARNAVYNATAPFPPSLQDPTYDADWMNKTHAVWFLLNSTGDLLWNVSYDWMNPFQYNHPAAIDVTGDGLLDLVSLDFNAIGHKPGDWQATSRPPNLFVLDGRDGSVVWRTPIGSYWSNSDFVIADVDGDARMDVLVGEPRYGTDDVGVYELATGAPKGQFPVKWAMTRGPVAGDLYGDGILHLVVPVARQITDRPNYRVISDDAAGYREGALVVLSTGQPYHVAFSANFLWSDDQRETAWHGPGPAPVPAPDPAIPVEETPPPSPGETGTEPPASPAAPAPEAPAPAPPAPAPPGRTPAAVPGADAAVVALTIGAAAAVAALGRSGRRQ